MSAVVDEVVDKSPSVDNLKLVISERIKQARGALSVTQKDLCAKVGMPLPSLRNYEAAKQIPGGEAVIGFMRAGINANWLLTGEGPMLLADLRVSTAGGFDHARFRLALEAVEEGLAAANRTMAPDKKSELVLAVYELFAEPANTKERILKLVKLAA